MKQEGFSNIQINDTFHKLSLYVARITKITNSNNRQVQKICHLAAQTCLKFCDKEQFAQHLCEHMKKLIYQQKNYFLLYLYDILIKNSRNMMVFGRKDLDSLFKFIWEQVWNDNKSKNLSKLECLKAMVRTWGVIYSEKFEQSLKNWLYSKYHINLWLQKKNEELLNQILQKYKNKLEGSGNQKTQISQKQRQVKPNKQKQSKIQI